MIGNIVGQFCLGMTNDAAGATTTKKKKREVSPAPAEEVASPTEEGQSHRYSIRKIAKAVANLI